MPTRRSATERITLPSARHDRVPIHAHQAAELYRRLRQLDQAQRADARNGIPVDLAQECLIQSTLLLVEPVVARGGNISRELAQTLTLLGLTRPV